MVSNTESAIWERVIEPAKEELLPEIAQAILRFDFRESDHQRMGELAAKCNEGLLTDDERAEYENYVRVGDVLALMQSLARRTLKHRTHLPPAPTLPISPSPVCTVTATRAPT